MNIKFIGFNFDKISIEKYKDISNNLNIKTNFEIKDIKDQNSDLLKNKNLIHFKYELTLDYSPNLAKIFFSGGILSLIEDEKLLKDIKTQWKDKKISEDLKIKLINIIFSKCNIRALQLEEDLNLPFHIPFPKVIKPEGKKDKE
jgi:hypothetical protein